MFSSDVRVLAKNIVSSYMATHRRIVTAESCTGGLVAGALTDIPGASSVLERGFVCYSNESKIEVLGVPQETLQQFGAVSSQTAEEMAKGALEFSLADVAVSVTGIAGPDGGTEEKPVGLVYFGLATRKGTVWYYKCTFSGSRDEIREQAVIEALKLVLTVADGID
ncbi:MAG: nicotinamide-nucleotide amidohydrolase family protein [Bdellovibrionales bacterium]